MTGRSTEAEKWAQRRRQLFGGQGRREWVAVELGLSLRTIERYEAEGPPAWYDFALVGLWNYRQLVMAGKEKPPAETGG